MLELANLVDRHHPLNRGRAAWWLAVPGLDGGRRLYDVIGLNHGTLDGSASWRAAIRPEGVGRLNITSGRVRIPHAAPLDIAAAGFTLAVTATRDGNLNTYNTTLVSKSNSPGSPYWSYVMRGHDSVAEQAAMGITYGTTNTILYTPALDLGRPYRLAMTCDGAAVRGYVDGAEIGSASVSGSPYNGTGELQVGDDAVYGPRYWPGTAADVSIWSRALSAAEVRAEYDLSRLGYPGVLRRVPPLRLVVATAPAPTSTPARIHSYPCGINCGLGRGVA